MPVCLALPDLSDRLVISVFGQDFLDAFYRVQEFADGIVVIQGVDDQGDVFAHIAVDIVRFTQQFRGLVDQVGGQDAVEGPFSLASSNFAMPLVNRPKVEHMKILLAPRSLRS